MVKLKKNPLNFVEMFMSKKNEYDKYIEAGNFSEEAFNELCSKRKHSFMDSVIDKIKTSPQKVEKQDYKIELQRNTGTFRLFIPTNLDRTSLSWIITHICELFDIKIQTDQDKNTYFIKDYNSVGYFHLSHLFDNVSASDELEWKKNNIVPSVGEIEAEARYLLSKIKIFLKMIDTIYARITEDTRIYKRGT